VSISAIPEDFFSNQHLVFTYVDLSIHTVFLIDITRIVEAVAVSLYSMFSMTSKNQMPIILPAYYLPISSLKEIRMNFHFEMGGTQLFP
jgi:hypothetical protein